jgi:demethylmenaquinone methyltransferase / 2-methoxy-6-polyprenyl-1,4-benzoquinol methylase
VVSSLITQSPKGLAKQFFGKNAHSYERIVYLTTFGRDSYWKKEVIKKIPKCDSIFDIACGTGLLTFKIAERFPDAKITGIDLSEEYLEIAKSKLEPFHKISFQLGDAEKLSIDDTFSCIISSYVPKYCDPKILIQKCLSHLKPGNKIILHDFVYPKNKVIRPMWNFYFIILNMIGLFAPSWKDVFKNLPQLIRNANWVDKYTNVLERNGLEVEVQYLTLGTSAILTGTKKV